MAHLRSGGLAFMIVFASGAVALQRGRCPSAAAAARTAGGVRTRFSKMPVGRAAVAGDTDDSGTSFYDRLGRPSAVMAPMVAQSDLPFRILCRRFGADLCYTQMIHAVNFDKDETFRVSHLDIYTPGADLLASRTANQWNAVEGCAEAVEGQVAVYDEGGPVIVQLAGHDPDVVVSAALKILDRTRGNPHLAGFDLNLGCPQNIARKGRYGAFLMEDSPDAVYKVLSRLRQTLPDDVGVTAKVRLPNLPETGVPPGLAEAELRDRVHRLVDAGVDLITVHGRTLRENKTRVRACNWDAIRVAVEAARSRSGDAEYPVIANGGIEHPSDVARCLGRTGASAVMSSEALLENPGIFASGAPDETDMSPREIFDRQVRYAREYLDIAAAYPPVPGSLGKTGGSFNVVRGHLFKMLYRYFEEDADLRDRLAEGTRTTSIDHARSILAELEGRYRGMSDDHFSGLPSSREGVGGVASSWYRRHRDAASRVKTRGDAQLNEERAASANMSVDEKKRILRERIKKLKEERQKKDASEVDAEVAV